MNLETARLRIRDWTVADAPAALEIQSRVEVMKWLGDGEPVLMKDLTEATERIAEWRLLDHPPCGYWALEVTESGPLQGRTLGSVLLVPLPKSNGEIQIGWHLHPDAWGHRFAAEAAVPVLARGFAAGLPEIHAVTHLTNDKSQSVCRQLGMEDRGVVHTWYDDPSQHFVITAEQWRHRRTATSPETT